MPDEGSKESKPSKIDGIFLVMPQEINVQLYARIQGNMPNIKVYPSDFRSYMRCLAGWVWGQQKSASHFGLTLNEETITEMLLLCMAEQLNLLGFTARIFNHKEESKIGADWEWYYKSPRCTVSFRVQAKRLHVDRKRDGEYGSFEPGGKQLKDLISNAHFSNPIYVFYNHPEVRDSKLFKSSRSLGYFGYSCWGCSVATAAFMENVNDKKLSTIFKGQIPWHLYFDIERICYSKLQTESMLGDQKLKWADDYKPKWVAPLLNTERESDRQLIEILSESGLKGVAYFGYN